MGKFKPINNVQELETLCKENQDNVGVTRSGELYSFDFVTNKPIKLPLADASERLGLSHDIMAEVIKTGGTFEIPEPITSEEEIDTPEEEIDTPEEEVDHPDEEVDHPDENKEIKKLKVEVKFSKKELEAIIEPLINEIKDLKATFETEKELSSSRYDEFLHFKNNLLL